MNEIGRVVARPCFLDRSMSHKDTSSNECSGESRGPIAEALSVAAIEGAAIAGAYRITTVIPYSKLPYELATYTLPPQDLEAFLADYQYTGEIIVDIRPWGGADGE